MTNTKHLVNLIKQVDSIRLALPSGHYLYIVSPTDERVLILDGRTHQPVIMVTEYVRGTKDYSLVVNTNRVSTTLDLNLVKATEFAFDINHSPILLSLAFSSDDKRLYIGNDADKFLTEVANAN